jgi:hypothetical protein
MAHLKNCLLFLLAATLPTSSSLAFTTNDSGRTYGRRNRRIFKSPEGVRENP